jgi:hypothetical protein
MLHFDSLNQLSVNNQKRDNKGRKWNIAAMLICFALGYIVTSSSKSGAVSRSTHNEVSQSKAEKLALQMLFMADRAGFLEDSGMENTREGRPELMAKYKGNKKYDVLFDKVLKSHRFEDLKKFIHHQFPDYTMDATFSEFVVNNGGNCELDFYGKEQCYLIGEKFVIWARDTFISQDKKSYNKRPLRY